MTKLQLLITGIVFGILITSCKEGGKQQENETPQKTEVSVGRIDSTLQFLIGNMEFAWDTMMTADDLKMSYLLRYIDEISYIPGADEDKIKELRALHQTVKDLRFDRYNLSSRQIDVYDSLQTLLIKNVYGVAKETPNIESYPLSEELSQDITELDLKLITQRSYYDEFSIPYNTILMFHKKELEELGDKYANLKEVAVFMIQPDYTDESFLQ